MSPSSSSDPQLPTGPFAESSIVEIDGVRLHLRTWLPEAEESGRSALLIHGFGGSTFSWRFVGPGLSSLGYRAIAVDLPGFGYSDRLPAAGRRERDVVELMWYLADELDEASAEWLLVGHSIGARVASAMASGSPERVGRLVVVDAAMYGPPPALPLLAFPPLRWFLGIWARNQLLTEKGIARLLESAYGREPDMDEIHGYLEPLLLPGTTASLVDAGALLPEIAGADLRRIAASCLVVWGEDDGWVEVKNALRIFNDLPTAEIFIIPGAGHIPIETHPDEVMERLADFLARR